MLGLGRRLLARRHSWSLERLLCSKPVCWSCGHSQTVCRSLFCEQCHVVQKPAQSSNFFDLLGVEQSYALDMSALQQKYRWLQTQLHPDKFINRSAAERAISSDFSALINRAYGALSQPAARALHLLQLAGAGLHDTEPAADADFLLEMLELNEAVEGASSVAELHALAAANERRLGDAEHQLGVLFRDQEIAQARELVIRMSYYRSLAGKIGDALERHL